MIKRFLIICAVFILLYTGLIQIQMFWAGKAHDRRSESTVTKAPAHKVYAFSFTKYTPQGAKELEIEGQSADILAKTVDLLNVVAKAYAEETPVTITADQGNYDKEKNKVHLKKNVVATTKDGTRLLTEELDILPEKRMIETDVQAEVKKDNINIEGEGAQGDSRLKKVRFKKNVTVIVQDPNEKQKSPTTITCDGPLIIDYEENVAHFSDNVVAQDERGKLQADKMDVYYNKISRRVSKIVAVGNVSIDNPDGNKTYSDNVIYLAEEGRIILGGDTEALYYKGENTKAGKDIF